MAKYGEGVYRIIHEVGGWCVAKLVGHSETGNPVWHCVSNKYLHRGWAQAWARRMKINVVNYESRFSKSYR